MRRVVHKYVLNDEWRQVVEMPKGATILSVQVQRRATTLWALVDPDAAIERRHFAIALTGDPVRFDEAKAQYIATLQHDGGDYVSHLFEVLP